MEFEVIDIIVFVTGIILGFVAALAFKSMSQRSSQLKSSATTATIDALQQDIERRQVLADDHFMQVNTQLTALDRKIADLRKVLSEGSSQLSGISISATPAIKMATNEEETTELDLAYVPRDYANKEQNEAGTLSEGFGLRRDQDEPSTPKAS